MSSTMDLIDQLGKALDEKPAPRLEYVERYPRRFDPHTMRQVEADLKRWAAEGDIYAQEALSLLELDV